jgi:lysophospholipase L1-like esterase
MSMTLTATRIAATIVVTVSAAGAAFAQTPLCQTPNEIVRLALPLPRVAAKVAAGEPITIVAVGSSSTAGAGASTSAGSYPSRLHAFLSEKFPRQKFKVINRGVNGEEIKDMLARLDSTVLSEKPDLVLWQLGTNSVLRDHPVDQSAAIREGIKRIKLAGADVVLIDPQFAPKVIAKSQCMRMVRLIGETAKAENVGLFQRYELMKHWHVAGRLPFETFISADGLHLNDWSYSCWAKGLANAIAEAATRPVMSATASPAAR